MIADQDEKGIAPGSDRLQAIFEKCAPCLILIDEWVAYLRQIYKIEGLPSGSFDANLSFVQSLTEAVKASPQTLLVASLPASQIEVGGEGGQEALSRLKQTFSRVESSWRPASQEESYEIVRRRLFKQIPGDRYMHRDNTLKQYAKMYRENPNDFPLGCADEDYRRKLEKLIQSIQICLIGYILLGVPRSSTTAVCCISWLKLFTSCGCLATPQ